MSGEAAAVLPRNVSIHPLADPCASRNAKVDLDIGGVRFITSASWGARGACDGLAVHVGDWRLLIFDLGQDENGDSIPPCVLVERRRIAAGAEAAFGEGSKSAFAEALEKALTDRWRVR